MGMIIPPDAGVGTVETDFNTDVAVMSGSHHNPYGPDAGTMARADFPLRDVPFGTGTRESRYQAVFKQSVLDDIREHGKSSPEAEVCGVLVGDVFADRMAPWVYIEHSIRGNNAVGRQTWRSPSPPETWTRIHGNAGQEISRQEDRRLVSHASRIWHLPIGNGQLHPG